MGVPEIKAVPFPLSLNVTPVGKAPASVNLGMGIPDVVTVNVPDVPTVKVVAGGLVKLRALVTVRVNDWIAVVLSPLFASMANPYSPAVPAAGVPPRVAVPFPLSVNATPLGSAPVSVRADVGLPIEVTVNEPGTCSVKFVLFDDVIAGP